MNYKLIIFLAVLFLTALQSHAFKKTLVSKRANQNGSRIIINVTYNHAQPGDTMFFHQLSPFYFIVAPHPNATSAIMDDDGKYHFQIDPKEKLGHYALVIRSGNPRIKGKRDTLLTPDFYFEPGDSLTINITKNLKVNSAADAFLKYNYQFLGRGSRKLELLIQSDSLQRSIGDSGLPIFDKDFKYQDPCIRKITAGYKFIVQHKNEISPEIYNMLQADIVYQNAVNRIHIIMDYYSNTVKKMSLPDKNRFVSSFNMQIQDAIVSLPVAKSGLMRSSLYLRYLDYKNRVKVYVEHNESRSPDSIFNLIVNSYNGELRDRLATYFLFRYKSSENLKDQLQRVSSFIKTPNCIIELEKLRTREKGTAAYRFELPTENGQIVKMQDFIGKVVVIDFWFTGCDWCTTFYKDVISKAETVFGGNPNVVFVSISTDSDKAKWISSIRSGKYTSERAINLFTNGAGVTHPIIRHYNILGFPSFIIINKKGKVEIYNTEEFRKNAEGIIRTISSLLK